MPPPATGVRLASIIQLSKDLPGVRYIFCSRTGGIPTANSRNNLFAIQEGLRWLVIYDLTTAAKLDQQIFPDAIAYAHFSEDGNRLLVLTRHQVAYVLDVSVLRANPYAAPAPH